MRPLKRNLKVWEQILNEFHPDIIDIVFKEDR
jgi:hypothetical protein